MIPHHSDGWRTLGKDDPMVVLHNAKMGWRKRTEHGAVYVFKYHLPTSPGHYAPRYIMQVRVRDGQVQVDMPVMVASEAFERVEKLLVSLGVALECGLQGVRP
jgi:hypothetical protein